MSKLTNAACKAIDRQGRHSDGAGLYLVVAKSGRKSWVYLYSVSGRRREMGLGGFPVVSLADARRAADEARAAVRRGEDPLERGEGEAVDAKGVTFAEAAEALIEAQEPSWRNPKHRQQWRNTLATYAAPIASMEVGKITADDVLRCLSPIWQDRAETASRVRGRIERVLDYSTVRGWREPGLNPAQWKGNLVHVLPARDRGDIEHRAAMDWREVPAFVASLQDIPGMAAPAVTFAILTAVRPGEARLAEWSEIDRDNAVWTIPRERMKMKKAHRVPLSPQALAVLDGLPVLGPLVFTGARIGRPLSDMAMLQLVKRRGRQDLTVHGFRSSFKDWATESGQPDELSEMCLAHAVGNKVRRAYARTDDLDRRREVMQSWADFVCL
ncbi:MAG: integrase arm-type DNA-binding domain-containing protein [Pseudomonadota bacterium]